VPPELCPPSSPPLEPHNRLSRPHCYLLNLAFSNLILLSFQSCTHHHDLAHCQLRLPSLTITPPDRIVTLTSPTSQSCPRHPDLIHHRPSQLHRHPATLALSWPRRRLCHAHVLLTLTVVVYVSQTPSSSPRLHHSSHRARATVLTLPAVCSAPPNLPVGLSFPPPRPHRNGHAIPTSPTVNFPPCPRLPLSQCHFHSPHIFIT
jgi:hypothetical protein